MTELILSIIAAVSLLALGTYALIKQRTVANAALFLSAILLAGIEIFDQLSLQLPADFTAIKQISLYLESLLPGSLLLLALTYGRISPFEKHSKMRLGLMAALTLFPLALLLFVGNDMYYSPDIQSERILFLDNTGYWYYIGIMVSLIVALVNVEATLGATYGMSLNQMKFEAIGLMGLLAVLIYYYSQGLLYRTINMNLISIRASVLIIAALLMGYSRIFRRIVSRVSISRHIFYRSVALMVVGVYLIGLGLVGEGMRYFGEAFGRRMTILIAFVGGILVLAILLSDKARRRLKVYINKHFYVYKHDYREEWIKFTNRLSLCASLNEVQESILTVFQETFGLAGASLYLLGRGEKQYVRVSEQFMPESPADLRVSDGLHAYFVERERVLSLTDGEYPLSASEKAVFQEAGAWLIVPLISSSKIEGIMMLREHIVPETLTYEDYDLMKVLARQASQTIRNYRLSEEVVEMRAMAAVSRISTFVIHDLKNLTTGLSLCVDNAEEYIGNPEFQKDAITTMRNTLIKMKDLMQRLRSIPEKTSLDSRVKDIDHLSREVVAEFAKFRPKRVGYKGVPVYSCVDGEEIKKVIVNLVQNALEASDEKGNVMVNTRKENNCVCIQVSDTGSGMTEDFIKNDLFKPFRTTKEAGLGIGLYQCRQIMEAHDGRIEVKSEPGKGSVFTICLPVAETVE